MMSLARIATVAAAALLSPAWPAAVAQPPKAGRKVESAGLYSQVRETDFFTGERHPAVPLGKERSADLLAELRRLDLGSGEKFERRTRTAPDARLEVTYDDGSRQTFYLLHRTTLVASDYSRQWEFRYGAELLRVLRRE